MNFISQFCMAFGVTAVKLQMVKKTKATSSPGIIDLRVLQGALGEGCVILFACFFLCQKGGMIKKKWWGEWEC